MLEILSAITEWLQPEMILKSGGLWLLLLIIFLETGIFFGFFLPGDSLLLTAGILCGSTYLEVSIYELLIGLSVAGFLGAMAGYVFGRKTGNYLLMKPESFFFKKKYLSIAEDYYLKYGNMAFVIGRFLPLARTFIPILAGFVKSNVWTFVWFNILGTIIWVGVFVLGGYWLARLFPAVTQYIEFFVLFLIFITSLPLLLSWLRRRKQHVQSIRKKIL
ncbi:DedA family protein [Catalinimonas niigatensis]|uniref:DedA family protein n=1 Tax=Catalinimonas niigatensis TaxID=1397264 RepID=UPI0026657A83|nr:DedA family protein [Catalinimonas niigatensis]WPP52419.1 DedA family protein [Catalinimonas niigatensis]